MKDSHADHCFFEHKKPRLRASPPKHAKKESIGVQETVDFSCIICASPVPPGNTGMYLRSP